MLNQFSRTELLFGKENMEKLEKARVAVFGIGGVGGYAVEALVRSGVGAIDIIDDDKVCLTNLNRQILAILTHCRATVSAGGNSRCLRVTSTGVKLRLISKLLDGSCIRISCSAS